MAGDISRQNGKKGGRPKGALGEKAKQEQEITRQFRERVMAEFGPLMEAHLEAAKGVFVMVTKNKQGEWVEVDDPVAMKLFLQTGEGFRIQQKAPNPQLLKDAWDRAAGTPVQQQDVNLSGQLDVITAVVHKHD